MSLQVYFRISEEPGTLFTDESNKFIQSMVIYGNPQWQYSHVDGTDANGKDFQGDEFQLRRFTLGARIHFGEYFTFSISTDVDDDGEPKEDINFDSLDYALHASDIVFDAQDAFNWDYYDQLQLRVGQFRVPSNSGRAVQSNSMRAIERTSLSNYSSPLDSVGIMLSGRRHRWDFDLGIFSGSDLDNGLSLDRGSYWLVHAGYLFGERQRVDDLRADLRVLVNNNSDEGETFTQDWVVSFSTVMRKRLWRLRADIIVGENGDQGGPTQGGGYWGATFSPSVWLIEDQLEAVFRYQYAEAERRNGYRISAHSARRIAEDVGADINNGYGDKHKSLYAGINYYICGDHTKAMLGFQWDDLTSRNKDIYQGLTIWTALRIYF